MRYLCGIGYNQVTNANQKPERMNGRSSVSLTSNNRKATETWLKRLRKRVQGQTWLKGAVNYDEDLHFSTYYLRASCAEVTAPLYPGYSCLVASYESFNESYYLLKDECRQSAVAIVNRALRQPRWLGGILRQIRRHSDGLRTIFPPETSSAMLARLSDAALLALYRRHDARNRALYKYARLPEALDRGVSYFTEFLQEDLRARGVGAADCSEAFAVLSEPAVPSVLAQEILEFDQIVQYARSHPKAVAESAEGPGRARMLLDPELFRRLETHRETWQFLPYHGYGRRELATLDQYIRRLLEQTRNPGALADCAGLMTRCHQAGPKRQQLLQRLRMDRAHAALFELYPEIGAVKLYRRYAQLRNFYYLDLLLAEIGRRLVVSEWTVRCMLPEEVIASLRSGRLVNPAIHERLGGCVFAVLNGQERVLTGDDAAEARQLFRSASRHVGESNVLHGAIACRGKAAGPCKIIIRADDCRGEIEKGTIVVSESTDPDLVRLLRAAGGVLTEQGGVTSHAAIICRELGVPTIIGIEGLLERVKDGDWIEMDADNGFVKLPGTRDTPGTGTPAISAQLQSADQIGGKAYNLGVVRSLGFSVPEYVVLEHQTVRDVARLPEGRSSRQIIEKTLRSLGVTNGDKLAVRSSALSEDREDGSAAGKYRSLLNIERHQLAGALRDFAQSNQLAGRGSVYRGAVIVQRMVQADYAGVCLTREGRAGKHEAVIIEMTAGGNAGVTGGTVRPDRVVVDRLTGDILDEHRYCAVLRQQPIDIAGLVQQFLTLESGFGQPLDIEWALARGQLYILQARPIVNGQCSSEAAEASPDRKA